jgi:hypothetical protein
MGSLSNDSPKIEHTKSPANKEAQKHIQLFVNGVYSCSGMPSVSTLGIAFRVDTIYTQDIFFNDLPLDSIFEDTADVLL